MPDVIAIYSGNKNETTAFFSEPGIDTGAIEHVAEIATPGFEVALRSPVNERNFSSQAAGAIKYVPMACAMRLNAKEQVLRKVRYCDRPEKLIYFGTGISWSNIEDLQARCGRYSELAKDLDKLENKCLSVDDRNSVRRQQFQQEYEHLQEEVDDLEAVLKKTQLISS